MSYASGPSVRTVFGAGTVVDRARLALGLSRDDLWVGYVAMGGSRSPEAIEDFLEGRADLSPFDYDMVAQVVNELFADHGITDPLPYSESFLASDGDR